MEQALAEYLTHAPIFVRDVSGRINYWSRGAFELYGYSLDEAVGQISHDLLHTKFPMPLEEINGWLFEHGGWEGILRHQRKDGSTLWTESRWRLRGGEFGNQIVEINTDVTQREVLAQELAHRIKNIVTTVQALAKFSLAGNPERGLPVFEERLKALSDANDLLVRNSWSKGYLDQVIAAAAARFNVEDRIIRRGPDDLIVPPASVVAYSLAFHELATNAIKYGALSVPEGRIEVMWRLRPEMPDHVHVIWREVGGPPVTPPERRGFGMQLIERAVSADLGTPVALRFEASGLVCEFDGNLVKEPDFGEDW